MAAGYFTASGIGIPAPTFTLSTPVFAASFINSSGVESTTGTITVTNTGTATISPTSFALSGTNASDFTVTGNTCTNLVASSSCTISLAFSATAPPGTLTAAIKVTDTVTGSYLSTNLSVTTAYATLTASPTTIAFGNQADNTTSSSYTILVTDQNGNPLGHGITATVSPSTYTLPSGSSCAPSTTQDCFLTVAFTPTTTGMVSGSVSIKDTTSNQTTSVSLSGTGTASVPAVMLSTTAISFPTTTDGTSSAAYPVTLTNTGTASLSISSIAVSGAVSGNFTQTNNCPSSLASGSYCTIEATFSPTTAGGQSATIQIVTNAATSPDKVTLIGTGQ